MPTEATTERDETEAHKGRTVRLIFRMTPAEAATLDARAKVAGVSRSAFIRAAALGGEVPAPKRSRAASAPRLDAAEFRQLVGIANNLNQIARTLNAGRPDIVGGDLGEALAELRAIWGRFL